MCTVQYSRQNKLRQFLNFVDYILLQLTLPCNVRTLVKCVNALDKQNLIVFKRARKVLTFFSSMIHPVSLFTVALQRQTALRAAQLQMRLRQHRRGGEVPEEQRHKDLESGSLRLLVQNYRAMQHRILLQPQHVQV